jgi:chromosome segregation and condensation protein ScpB
MNAPASRGKRKSGGGQAAINAHAVRAVVQILFATGKPYTLETLRERLREFFVEEGDYEKRAVASMSAVQLITAILEAGPQLEALGLQIRLTNGVAQIFTSKIQNERLAAFIAERAPVGAAGVGELTPAALEVLACIAFKQPISQGEIDQIFGNVDKRHLVSVLRQMELVEEFAGPDGRLRFATTGRFLERFEIGSIEDLRSLMERASAESSKEAVVQEGEEDARGISI